MSQSYDLFCRWKHVQKIQSDNAGAIALGVTRAAVSSWKQGKNAEIQYIEKMALDIGDSPESWSALVMAERSNSEDEKAAWTRIARKLGAVAMALVMGVGLASPAHVQAAEAGVSAAPSIHYAKWRNQAPALDLALDHFSPTICSSQTFWGRQGRDSAFRGRQFCSETNQCRDFWIFVFTT